MGTRGPKEVKCPASATALGPGSVHTEVDTPGGRHRLPVLPPPPPSSPPLPDPVSRPGPRVRVRTTVGPLSVHTRPHPAQPAWGPQTPPLSARETRFRGRGSDTTGPRVVRPPSTVETGVEPRAVRCPPPLRDVKGLSRRWDSRGQSRMTGGTRCQNNWFNCARPLWTHWNRVRRLCP